MPAQWPRDGDLPAPWVMASIAARREPYRGQGVIEPAIAPPIGIQDRVAWPFVLLLLTVWWPPPCHVDEEVRDEDKEEEETGLSRGHGQPWVRSGGI